MNKKISIITINFNNAIGLLNTINSVKAQNNTAIEYIVIDGKSNDNSIDIVKSNTQYINYYLIENDNGIYDAMNKGVKLATTNNLMFLNSGDTFYNNNVVDTLLPQLNNEDVNIYYGKPNIIFNNGKTMVLEELPQIMNLKFILNSTINHQSSIINKKYLQNCGLYDTNYKYIADYDFFLKTYSQNPKSFKFLDIVIANYKLDGASSLAENQLQIKNERYKIQQKYYTIEIIETNIKMFAIENNKHYYLLNNNAKNLLIKIVYYYFNILKLFIYRLFH